MCSTSEKFVHDQGVPSYAFHVGTSATDGYNNGSFTASNPICNVWFWQTFIQLGKQPPQ